MSNKIICFFLFFYFSFVYSAENPPILINNETIEINSEGIAYLGSGMNEDEAKAIAINDAKRNALEKAGTYLESNTEVLNYKLVKDEIITYTGGLLESELISTESLLIDKRFAIKVTIKVTIDIKVLKERIEKIRNDNYLKKQLEEERKRNEALTKKMVKLQGNKVTKENIKEVIDLLSANELLDKGKRAYNVSNDSSAINLLEKAIEIDPKLIYAYYWLANSYKKFNKDKQAFEIINKVIEENPDSANAYLIRGDYYKGLNDKEKAIKEYGKAVIVQPTYTKSYVYRGNLYLKKGEKDKAFRDFNKAISIAPKDAYLHEQRGNAYFDLEEYDKAYNDHKKAVSLDSNLIISKWNSKANDIFSFPGISLQEMRKSWLKFDSIAIDINPKHPDFYISRGDSYFELKKIDKAFKDYEIAFENYAVAIKKSTKSKIQVAYAYSHRARQYARLKKNDEAFKDFNKAISLDPVSGYYHQGNFYFNSGYYDKAFEDHKKSIESDSSLAHKPLCYQFKKQFTMLSWRKEALRFVLEGNYQNALKCINNSIFFIPENASTISTRGDIYVLLKNYDLAFKDFNKAISLQPNKGDFYSHRASLLNELKRYEKAIFDYNKAIGFLKDSLSQLKTFLNKNNIEDNGVNFSIKNNIKLIEINLYDAFYGRGNAYSNMGQYELSINDYSDAIKINPNSYLIYYNRGNTYFKIEKDIKAINDYTKAIELNPEYSYAFYSRGLIYVMLGKENDAVNDFNECIKIDKNRELTKKAREIIRELGHSPKY